MDGPHHAAFLLRCCQRITSTASTSPPVRVSQPSARVKEAPVCPLTSCLNVLKGTSKKSAVC